MIYDPTDPRLADYLALNDPPRRREVERRGNYFIVEGIVAIERLLASPHWSVRSLLLLDTAAARLVDRLPAGRAPILVATPKVLRSVVGFDLHRGALASVDRPAPRSAMDLIGGARLVMLVEGVNDHENLGGLFRNAAAFGVDAMLLDRTTADPLYRRSVRVSMGHVLDVPFARVDLPDFVHAVRSAGGSVLGLTPSVGSPDVRTVDPARLGRPLVLAVGAEGPGLTASTLDAVDLRGRIPMASGVDSLNVATAAAVALAHLRYR